MSINLEWYRVFYWTAKLGGVTSAAKKLSITQPAVSHTLKQLENCLGGQLFFRTSKGVTLTTEGEVLYRFVEQSMQLIEFGEKKMSEMHNLLIGEINIGASDTLCKHYLLPFLEQFHKQYPEIKIRVTNRTTPETIALLKEGIIDFGVVNLPAEDTKLHFYQSALQQDCLVGSSKFVHLTEKPFLLKELNQYPILLLEKGGSTRGYLDQYAASHGVTLNPEFELGSVDLLVQFARSGFGLTFAVREFIIEELEAGNLIEIPLVPRVPERHIGIATLKDVPLSAAAKGFLAHLMDENA
ncbi:LysR family transcriptional regulator [Paenibacillus sp. N1-5-1-14]|uniref:LysR family transcriptional regulator n=1 Tax=Paenibacillus radicibacter TaxID=2972488 RepID=UPI00215993FA|nr:LysR family transcriptional regulator [Paenibacillus radicibacter]MCR8644239.1 LysR family transcriptional regulator [Paenibacillus radicibacter]